MKQTSKTKKRRPAQGHVPVACGARGSEGRLRQVVTPQYDAAPGKEIYLSGRGGKGDRPVIAVNRNHGKGPLAAFATLIGMKVFCPKLDPDLHRTAPA